MKKFLSNLALGYSAEHIKLKRTGFYVISFLVGIFCPVFYLIIRLNGAHSISGSHNHYQAFVHEALLLYANFFLPLLIIISVSRITQFDHKNGGWQLMETQPLSKASIYFSKLLIVIADVFVSVLVMVGCCYLSGFILTFAETLPEGTTTTFNVVFVIKLVTRLLITSLFLISLQYCISVLIPSFIWSILIGFAGLLVFLFLTILQVSVDWYPYDVIGRIYKFEKGSDLGYWFTYTDVFSLAMGIIISTIGFQWYRFKKFKLAFLTHKRLSFSVAVLAVTCLVVGYILRAREGEVHSRTVLNGRVDSDKAIDTIWVVDHVGVDTVAVIPVTNGSFKHVIDKELLPDDFTFYAGEFNFPVYFGERDSVFVSFENRNNTLRVEVTGSRLAENKVEKRPPGVTGIAAYMITSNQNLNKPELIADILFEEWEEDIQKPEFKSVDGFVARKDFRDREYIVITASYLNYWNDYMRRRAGVYDTAKDVTPDKINVMKSQVPMRIESYLSKNEYLQYVLTDLTNRIQGNQEEEERRIQAIAGLDNGNLKNKLLYFVLRKAVFYSDGAERRNTVSAHIDKFDEEKYKVALLGQLRFAESLGRGMPAPATRLVSMQGESKSLEDLKGKVTVIDVWASWCQPCKLQSPYFERLASKYASDKVQFVALSIDESEQSWLIDARAHAESIPQLRVIDHDKFLADYGIAGIPHFLLLDAAGSILNTNLPNPTDSNFELILRNELGIK